MAYSEYQRVEAHTRGGPEVLRLTKAAVTSPAAGEVRVRVLAAGVSFGDILNRVGVIPGAAPRPYVPGFDITGRVDAIGEGVTDLQPGQLVTGLLHSGGYSEYAVVAAGRLVPVPHGLDPVDAAASVLNFYVALQMLHRVARVQPGQISLVHGAAGGVGIALLQLARLSGVRCYGTCSVSKSTIVERQGALPVDYRARDFVAELCRAEPAGIDIVFDPIGGSNFRRSYSLLRKGGILIAFGQSAAYSNGRALRRVALSGLLGLLRAKLVPDGRQATFYTAWSVEHRRPEAYREDMERVLNLLAHGKLSPVIASRLPLADVAKAHVMLEQGQVSGKIVLTMQHGH